MQQHSIQQVFHHQQGEYTRQIASFACCGTNIGKMRISGFGLWQAKVQTRDYRHVSCKACCLVRVGIGSMFGVVINTRVRITGNRATGPEKRQCLDHSRHFSGVVGVSSGTCGSEMSLGGDDWTKLNISSSIGRSSDGTPPSRGLTICNASTAVCVDGPSVKVLASFACCGTSVGEMRIFGFGFR